MILIKNGNIIENNQTVTKDILIENGNIIKIDTNIECDAEIIDATNMLVIPGCVDVHVHLREPGFENKETVKSGTMSCAKGGLTSIMSMPNLNPCPDSLEHLNKQIEIIKKDALINVYPFGTITINEQDINEYFELETLKTIVKQPLVLTETLNNVDVVVNIYGGGKAGQAGAIRHGITRALIEFRPELRADLKKAGFVTRDARKKERKKYGLKKARRAPQFSKR